MKRSSDLLRWLTVGLGAAVTSLVSPAWAQTASQNLSLSAGWNAVWLEVEPVSAAGQPKAPQEVFNNAAIQVVATPKPLAGLAEFFASDPGTIAPFNQDEWQQWKQTDPAGGNNLALIFGNRPYLIQVAAGTATFSMPLTGKARFFRPIWTADRYNLLGFGLDGAPSFDQFFGPSGAKHPVSRIFSLNPDGNWVGVTGSSTMVSDKAYWIYSAGPSTYMGPVAVDFDFSVTGNLNFGGPADAIPVGAGADMLRLDLRELTFTNLSAASTVPGLDLISAGSSPGSLELHVVKPAADSLSYVRGNQVDPTPGGVIPPATTAALGETVAPQASATLTLGARRNGSFGAGGRTDLYRLRTGAGSLFWLPVTGLDSDLPADTAPAAAGAPPVTGLWVGDVLFDAATSIVEDGAPTRPSAGSSLMRLILHSDATGAVRLLSQVTIMQTKTADPAVPPEPVLVVDPASIPFFEGIKERNGKRVGVRLEAVAYDMPRDTSLPAQGENPVTAASDDLIDMIVAESASPVTGWASGKGLYLTRASVTPAAIDSYLLFRSSRPPALREKYLLSLPLTGGIGAGGTVTGSLALDPFHRSNPFRHAFHPKHAKGPNIIRDLEIEFDPSQEVADRLRGSVTETIHHLVKDDLVLKGRVVMRRVSAVSTLEDAR